MTILEELSSKDSDSFCGSACFASLLAFCTLEEEEKAKRMEAEIKSLARLDCLAFKASRGEIEDASTILERTRDGYQKIIAWLKTLEKKKLSSFLKAKIHTDRLFLESLAQTLEVAI